MDHCQGHIVGLKNVAPFSYGPLQHLILCQFRRMHHLQRRSSPITLEVEQKRCLHFVHEMCCLVVDEPHVVSIANNFGLVVEFQHPHQVVHKLVQRFAGVSKLLAWDGGKFKELSLVRRSEYF